MQLTVIPSRRQENSHNADLLHYLWVDSERRPVSPPVDLAYDSSHHRGIEGRDGGVRTVTLNVEKGLPLGLLIRGGMEDGLGIFVTGVDNPSAADLAGLQVGDQILSVNDKSFKSIRHDEAVDILKFSPHMTMTVRYVGKIPHACTPYSGQSWYDEHQQLSSPRLNRIRESYNIMMRQELLEILEKERFRTPPCRENLAPYAISTSPTEEAEKILYHRAQQVLTESEKICLAYYCNEYETRAITVDAFVAILMELLVNPEKYLLMTHIRGIVRREDLKKFDDLIYKCEIQTIKSKEVLKQATDQSENTQTLLISPSKEAHSPRGSFRKQKNSHHHRLTVPDHLAPHKVGPSAENSGASSQDSDVDVAGGNRSIYGMSKSARSAHGSRLQVSDNHNKSDPWKSSRLYPRRSIKRDTKGTSPATLLRRLTLRRHSSGGEGVNPEERRISSRVTEERRWSLGSELLETHEDNKPEVTLNVEKRLTSGATDTWRYGRRLRDFFYRVDNPSAADLAGLQVGDQILSVNDKSFKSIRHDEAVDILKFSPHMTMTVRYVGKIPHACTPYSGQSWYDEHQQLSSPRLSRRGSSRKREKSRDLEAISTSPTEEAEKILYHRAQQVLTESEKICLAYYCNEYETRAITVDAFVAILMELLVNPEKYLLMTHIRGIVRREDLKKFDDLIYKCEIQTIKSKEVLKQATDQSENTQTLLISPSKEAHSPRGSFRKQKIHTIIVSLSQII
ncbi:uncharacterized protein LOC143245668 [Tachypleus tridentatus]|uniref:uncharacterized protein LOC143245668 n=1 Tax=Tachypleus tridentatus TaxID=6853 RepID=UPI003FD0A2D0